MTQTTQSELTKAFDQACSLVEVIVVTDDQIGLDFAVQALTAMYDAGTEAEQAEMARIADEDYSIGFLL